MKGLPPHLRVVAVLVVAAFSCNFLVPLLLPLLTATGLSTRDAALFQAVAFALSGIIQPFVGGQFDQRGPLWPILISFLGVTAGVGALLLGLTGWILLLAVPFALLGTAIQMTAITQCLEATQPRETQARSISFSYLIHNVGMGIAAVVGFLFLANHKALLLGLNWITSVALLISLTVALRKTHPAIRGGENFTITRTQFKHTDKEILWIVLGMLLLLIPMFTHTSAIPIVLEQNGLDIQKITSVTVAANCFTVIFINWLTVNGRLALPPRVNFIVSTLLLCLGLAAIPQVHTISSAVCSTIIWSSGEALLFPLLTSILFQAFPRHQAGLASGVKVLLVRVSLVITPLIGSMLVGRPPWIFAPVFIGLCLVGFLFSFPTLRHLETGILERRETNKVSESAGVVTK